LFVEGAVKVLNSEEVRVSNVHQSDPQPHCGTTPYNPTWTHNTVAMAGNLPALSCTMEFAITVENDSSQPIVISQIIENLFTNSDYQQYTFSITPLTTGAVVPANGNLEFTVTFSYQNGLSVLPQKTNFAAEFTLVFETIVPPVLTASNASRNFEIFRGNTVLTPAALNARVFALDDLEGDITSNITKTCYNSSNQIITCPTTWAALARGDYQITYNVTNSYGLSAVPLTFAVNLWDFIKVDGGTYHAVAVGSNGDLYTWGYNAGSRLGLGDTTRRLSPVKMELSSAEIVDAAACDNSGHAVDAAGNLYSWGSGGNYSLGTNSTSTQSTPVLISPPSGEKYVQVSCFYNTGAALTNAGNVYTWGWEGYGANGHGNDGDKRVPTKLPTLSNIVKIDMGYYNGGAIDSSGNLYEWGTNGQGQLGVGSTGAVSALGITTYYNTPGQYNGITGAKDICFGEYHAVLVKTNGQVLTWGANGLGRIGNGTASTNTYSPYTTSITNGVSCAADVYGSAVATSDGKAYYFGSNNYGEMGTGSTSTNVTSPTASSVSGVTDVALQLDSGHALGGSGITTYGFGYNGNGELGIGTSSSTSTITAWALTAPVVVEW
jgi:alpha-tubulin suppressor-like RCC1 family protein